MAALDLPTAEDVRRIVRDELERVLADLRAVAAPAGDPQITIPEAARRLGVTTRAVQRWLKDGRLELVPVGGVRMVRWPPRTPPR